MSVRVIYPQRNTKSIRVHVGRLTLWFSYETIIAFDSPITGFWIRENDWSTTTGRHLNEIDEDKEVRLRSALFEEQLNITLRKHGLYF